jgi:hypothetical protein
MLLIEVEYGMSASEGFLLLELQSFALLAFLPDRQFGTLSGSNYESNCTRLQRHNLSIKNLPFNDSLVPNVVRDVLVTDNPLWS